MPLERIPFNAYNRPVESLRHTEPFDFDAPYQRGDVWTLTDRLQLIRSLLQGVPVGAIYINHRHWDHPPVVVDGKQRLKTLYAFMDDQFAVPAAWFADHATETSDQPSLQPGSQHLLDADVHFSDLTSRGQGRLLRTTLVFYETDFPTEAAERDLYERVNWSGVRHTDADRARAQS